MCYPCPDTPVTYVSGPYTAAKKVTAAPHRGNANKPIRKRDPAKKPNHAESNAFFPQAKQSTNIHPLDCFASQEAPNEASRCTKKAW